MENSQSNNQNDRLFRYGCSSLLFIIGFFLIGLLIYDEIKIKNENELIKTEFEKIVTNNLPVNELIQKYLNNSIKITGKEKIKIDGPFSCLFSQNGNISLYINLNKKFNDNGVEIANHPDSLNYIVLCEKKDIKVGSYTNGYDAFEVESAVVLFDISKSVVYEINRQIGDWPPITISGNYNGRGSSYTDSDFYNIINSLLKP